MNKNEYDNTSNNKKDEHICCGTTDRNYNSFRMNKNQQHGYHYDVEVDDRVLYCSSDDYDDDDDDDDYYDDVLDKKNIMNSDDDCIDYFGDEKGGEEVQTKGIIVRQQLNKMMLAKQQRYTSRRNLMKRRGAVLLTATTRKNRSNNNGYQYTTQDDNEYDEVKDALEDDSELPSNPVAVEYCVQQQQQQQQQQKQQQQQQHEHRELLTSSFADCTKWNLLCRVPSIALVGTLVTILLVLVNTIGHRNEINPASKETDFPTTAMTTMTATTTTWMTRVPVVISPSSSVAAELYDSFNGTAHHDSISGETTNNSSSNNTTYDDADDHSPP